MAYVRRNTIKCIGILTGGGDCPGLNAVIRAAVKTAIGRYKWKVLGIEDGFEGFLRKGSIKELTLGSVRGILPRGGTILGTTNRGNPFRMIVKRGGVEKVVDSSKRILASFRDSGMDALVVIGGEGSLGIARDLYKMGMPVVGVPKTIDNDLSATDITFGFDTAVNTATEALDRLHTTAESHHRAMVLEVMGRHAGWIALRAGISGGADIILIPEIPYDIDKVCSAIKHREKHSKFSIVVVAEGAMPAGGDISSIGKTADGVVRLGGVGDRVARAIEERTGVETRVTVLGHLQRGGRPTSFDRLLGTRFGAAAIDLVARGGFGRMVALRTPSIVDVDIVEACGRLNTVDPKGDLIVTARDVGISLGA